MKFLLYTPTGEMNNMLREIYIYIYIYACILEFKITISGVDPTRSTGRRYSLLMEKSELIFKL